MFWRKKKPQTKVINIETHLREFFYDSQLPEAEELAVLFGASPISKEGEEHEENRSDERVSKISHILSLVEVYSTMMTDGLVELEATSKDEDATDAPPEFWASMKTMLHTVSSATTIGVISQLVDLGLITVPRNISRSKK